MPKEVKRSKSLAITPVTGKNFEKRVTDVYYKNAVEMLEEALVTLRRLVTDQKTSEMAKIKACETVLQATKIIKDKNPIVQVNTQINNREEKSDGRGQSFESILRRLDARDNVIDITAQP